MAARKEDPKPAKSKMTFIMFQLDGGDETLQQSFRTIGQALGNAFGHAKQLPNKPSPSGAQGDLEIESEVLEEPEASPGNGQEETSFANKPRTRPAPKSPTLLDLNLNDGTPPLKEFLATKRPGDQDSKRYLAIAHWFKHHFKTPEVTVNHIFTGYRHMGWQTPKDPALPLRDLKNKNQWLTKGTTPGSFTTNHIGDDQVFAMGAES